MKESPQFTEQIGSINVFLLTFHGIYVRLILFVHVPCTFCSNNGFGFVSICPETKVFLPAKGSLRRENHWYSFYLVNNVHRNGSRGASSF